MLSDTQVIERLLNHIDHKTTDMGDEGWQEPVENYSSEARFNLERQLMRRLPIVFCPEAALPVNGSYVARNAIGTPIVVVRDNEGEIRAFRNACRHRGKQIMHGSGCTKVLKCGYHGWAYRLDGQLQHIPHEHGFPDLDKNAHGLVPVQVEVAGGLVFVTQEAQIDRGALIDMPDLISPDQTIFASGETGGDFNWKLNIEATLEGYHIKPTHGETFYPYGYDNLNVVETFGPNSRVTFPFRRIEKLRDVPAQQRKVDRVLTYVHNVFPFTTVARLSSHTSVSISEPESPTRTRYITYKLGSPGRVNNSDELERAKKDAEFVSDTGLQEDAAVVRDIQAGLASGANDHFTYGRFEKAIVHFHKHIHQYLALLEEQRTTATPSR